MSRKGEVVSNSKSIAVNYLRGWFMVDLFAALPFDHLYASNVISGEVRDNTIIIHVLSGFEDSIMQIRLFTQTPRKRMSHHS